MTLSSILNHLCVESTDQVNNLALVFGGFQSDNNSVSYSDLKNKLILVCIKFLTHAVDYLTTKKLT